MTQEFNAQLIDWLATHFPQRIEPNYAWGNVLSGHLSLPKLRGQWAASTDEAGNVYDHSGQGRMMRAIASPGVSMYGLAPYHDFRRSSSQYYTRNTEPGLQITNSLTIWIWAYFHTECTGNAVAMFSKWGSAAGNYGWMLSKSAGNQINFDLSVDGTAVNTVSADVGDYTINEWRFICGRFTTSTEQKLWVGFPKTGRLKPYIDNTAIPASIFNTTASMDVARNGSGNYHDGYLVFWGLCNFILPDASVFNLFHSTRPMYVW